MKSRSLNLLEPSGSHLACYLYLYIYIFFFKPKTAWKSLLVHLQNRSIGKTYSSNTPDKQIFFGSNELRLEINIWVSKQLRAKVQVFWGVTLLCFGSSCEQDWGHCVPLECRLLFTIQHGVTSQTISPLAAQLWELEISATDIRLTFIRLMTYIYIYIYMSYRTANLQMLHFIYLFNKYTYWIF